VAVYSRPPACLFAPAFCKAFARAGCEVPKNHFSVASLDASLALAAFDGSQAVGSMLKWEALARRPGVAPGGGSWHLHTPMLSI